MEHKPSEWKLVVQDSDVLVVTAMCICGDDDCYFRGSIYKSQWTWLGHATSPEPPTHP